MSDSRTKKNKQVFRQLHAPYEDAEALSWDSVHPMPLMKRPGYRMLNGLWNLSVVKKGADTRAESARIRVPMPPECGRSVFASDGKTPAGPLKLKRDESWLYEREFDISEKERSGRVLLHFGAVDQVCRVCVNDAPAGRHKGGYLPFTIDITHLLVTGVNQLSVQV